MTVQLFELHRPSRFSVVRNGDHFSSEKKSFALSQSQHGLKNPPKEPLFGKIFANERSLAELEHQFFGLSGFKCESAELHRSRKTLLKLIFTAEEAQTVILDQTFSEPVELERVFVIVQRASSEGMYIVPKGVKDSLTGIKSLRYLKFGSINLVISVL
jgi:hypothetical protein